MRPEPVPIMACRWRTLRKCLLPTPYEDRMGIAWRRRNNSVLLRVLCSGKFGRSTLNYLTKTADMRAPDDPGDMKGDFARILSGMVNIVVASQRTLDRFPPPDNLRMAPDNPKPWHQNRSPNHRLVYSQQVAFRSSVHLLESEFSFPVYLR